MAAVSKILAVLLIVSLAGNVYLAFSSGTLPGPGGELQSQVNSLDAQVAALENRVNEDNLTIRSDTNQLDTYRQMIAQLQGELKVTSSPLQGYATLQGPAVIQRVQVTQDTYFPMQQVVTEGTMINISVEVRPGEGRVLVETTPLMGIVFQDAANTAVFVAQNRTGKSLAGSDVIFSVAAENQIPAVDGPSAGALMTSLAISALENRAPREDVTLTGTIDQNGHVGAIGGVIEKAQAAKASGKSEILLPRENAQLVQYIQRTRNMGGITMIERTPQVIDTKEYIENNVGIRVVYVDTIEDVLAGLGIPG